VHQRCIRDTCTPDTRTQGICIRDTRTRDTCTRDTGIRDTRTRDTSGAADILAGTDTDTTGVAEDMFDPTGVQRGRRGDGHMAARMVGGAIGTDS